MSLDQLHLLPLAQQEATLNSPAHVPPPGVIPNLEDPPNNNGLALFAATICLVVSTLAFLIGAYTKIFCVKKIHIEDFLAFSGYCLSVAYCGCVYHIVNDVGYFVHQWDVRVKDLAGIFYDVHIASDFYVVSIMLFKAAILLEWMRIFVPRNTRGSFYWTCYVLVWLNTLSYIALVVSGSLSCTPFEKLWDPTVPGICKNRKAYDVATAAVSLLSDIIILLLPQRIIWNLHLRKEKKIGIALIFAIGLFACIATAFRLSASVQYLNSDDSTYHISRAGLWCAAEQTCGILVFSVPRIPKAMKDSPPAVKKFASRIFGSRSSSYEKEPKYATADSTSWPGSNSRKSNSGGGGGGGGGVYKLSSESSSTPRSDRGSSNSQDLESRYLPRDYNDLSRISRPHHGILRTTQITAHEEYENGAVVDMPQLSTPWNQQHAR